MTYDRSEVFEMLIWKNNDFIYICTIERKKIEYICRLCTGPVLVMYIAWPFDFNDLD